MFQNRGNETFSSVLKRVVDSLSLGNERIVKLVLYETLQMQKRGKRKKHEKGDKKRRKRGNEINAERG